MGTGQQRPHVDALLARVSALVGPKPSRTAAHLLAEVLQQEIVSARIAAGTRLFDEATLRRRTGLSRTVIREAVRLLESRGLVAVRVGGKGGVYVRDYDYKALRDSLAVLIALCAAEPMQVLEARREMEALCAKLAARHATESDVRALHDSLRRQGESQDDPAAFLEENIRFHLVVADSTRNPIIASVMHSLRDIVQSTSLDYSYSLDALRAAFAAHRRLVQAIVERDEVAAARIMERHMDAVAQYLRHSGQLDL